MGVRIVSPSFWNAEVHQVDLGALRWEHRVGADQNIFWLEVLLNEPYIVQGLEAIDQLLTNLHDRFEIELAAISLLDQGL